MIPARMKKVVRDLATRWGRTLLTIGGLSIGLFGLCSVLVAFTILSNDLNANFRNTNPPNIIVRNAEFAPATLDRIRAIDGVRDVETRAASQARIQSSMGGWMPMTLSIVEDFETMRVARFYREEGAWPPPPGGLLIERDGRFFIREPLGAPMRVRFADGREVTAPLSGWSYDPGQAPSRMEMATYGYVSRETANVWGLEAARTRLLITVDGADSMRMSINSQARTVAREIETILRAEGATAPRVEVFDSPEHPHQFQLNAMVALLAGIAVVSLMLCIVLVVNLFDALMANEQRSIGVMRAVGGRSGQIARDYLIGVGVLGLVSSALSLAFAIDMGRGLATFVSRMLNFDILTNPNPAVLALGVLAVGFVLPVLVASIRVTRAVNMPVRDALSRIDPASGGAVTQFLGGVFAPLPVTPRSAARALLVRPRRALFTAAALAMGLLFFLAALNIRTSLWETVDAVGRTKPFDMMMILRAPESTERLDAWLRQIPEVQRTEFWSGGEGTLYAEGLQISNPTTILATPAQSWAMRPEVIQGDWLSARRPNGLVVTQKFMADNPLAQIGAPYDLRVGAATARVEIVGVVREFGPGYFYIQLPLFEQLHPTSGTAGVVLLELSEMDFWAERGFAGEMEDSAREAGVNVGMVMTSGLLRGIVVNHLDSIAVVLQVIALIALAVGIVGLASSISVSVVERYREVAVLKAIGGRSFAVASLFITEAMFIAVIGWLAALAASPWLSREIAAYFGTVIIQYPFDYRAFPFGSLMALGVALAIALFASLLPIRSALAMTTHRALRSE
jgi:putative ABC transport system permease protein